MTREPVLPKNGGPKKPIQLASHCAANSSVGIPRRPDTPSAIRTKLTGEFTGRPRVSVAGWETQSAGGN